MSDCNGPSCSRSRVGVLSRGVKPRHVRSLNFGQSILELDVVEQRSVPNRVLVIDENVARIPCTEKGDYVRKWLETHENGGSDPYQLSPVLGTSATTASQRSPILSNGRKRPRGKICINRNATAKRLGNADRQGNTGHSANYTMRSKSCHGSKEKSKNERELMSETQCTPSGIEKVADGGSPVLGTHRVFKKKRRKLQYENNDSLKCSKLSNPKIISVNIKSITEPVLMNDNHGNLREIPVDQDQVGENLDKTRTFIFSTEAKKSPEKYQRSIDTCSSSTKEKLSFADSSSNNTDKNDSEIETDTSNNSEHEECNQPTSTSSSSIKLSNFIEDADTQETTKTSQFNNSNKYLIPSGQPFTLLQVTTNDLDETYCSEAEIMQNQSTHLSAMISEVPSLNKTTQKTGSKSTQTDAIISIITTPSKKSPDRNMYACLLDSGKKRRKPKR